MEESWPDPEEALTLHRRLGASDPVAPSDFAAAFLDPLVAFLRADSPNADEHARLTAAEEAVLSVIRRPGVFDPARGHGGLAAFLRMAARQDLKNVLERERRHQRRREFGDCVELAADGGNSSQNDMDDPPSFADPEIVAAVAAFTDEERRVFELMKAGERRTEVYATILGITHLAPEEQAREVKRVKERIFKRLRRAKGGS